MSADQDLNNGHLVLAIDVQLHQLSALVFDPTSSSDSESQQKQPVTHRCVLWQKTISFDDDFPEFQTKRGSYRPPSFDEDHPRDVALTPVGVVVRALDAMLHALSRASYVPARDGEGGGGTSGAAGVTPSGPSSSPCALMSRVGTVGVSGTLDVPILLSKTACTLLQQLNHENPLWTQLGCPSFFATAFVPNVRDWTLDSEAVTIQQISHELELKLELDLGGFYQGQGRARAHTASHSSATAVDASNHSDEQKTTKTIVNDDPAKLNFAAALLRIRLDAEADLAATSAATAHAHAHGHGQPTPPPTASSPWLRMGRITSMAGLITSLLTGEIAPWRPDEAALSMLYDPHRVEGGGGNGAWNEVLLSIIEGAANNNNGAVNLGTALGAIDHSSPSEAAVGLGSWIARRYQFAEGCTVVPQISSYVGAATACLLSPGDSIIHLGLDDVLLVALDEPIQQEQQAATLVPFPSSHVEGGRDVRTTKTPSFLAVAQHRDAGVARLIVRSAYCNDRWSVMNRLVNAVPVGGSIGLDNKLFTRVVSTCGIQDIRRYERGCRVTEFSDLRANARCLLEGQALSIRSDLVAIRRAGQGQLLPTIPGKVEHQQHHAQSNGTTSTSTTPYPTPRLFALGKPAGNKTLASILSSALGSALQIPTAYLSSSLEDDDDGSDGRRTRTRTRTRTRSGGATTYSGSEGSSGPPPSSGRGSSSNDADAESTSTFCPILLGTALYALSVRWKAGVPSGVGTNLHPSALAVLEYFGRRVSPSSSSPVDNGGSSPSSSSSADRINSTTPRAALECQEVSYSELANFYAALAPEHERLSGVGISGRL
ncbi:unnamed protein product [Tilletia laevis]|uniref:Uncharacterized protein n=2 Tax=Tilletia TaxID=13289 RepID=A0A177VE28_9BASI|nr:hypothetical protein CF335_g7421 [Tilletia laevis]KAE8260598.1 hypothetical protein A4X03_0g3764 [Tilletia caries]KAE8196459.1 hypothetical protein CF336_g2611 [Tilletia laevis]CAD6900109.1 unnamed protein product [Tilletia caries]CAD6928099.1 unnamed protein product [Tilletia laevis]